MPRASCCVAGLALLLLGLSCTLADNAAGTATSAGGPVSPFTNPNARAAQFGQQSDAADQFCLARDVSFGDATSFEAWIYPTKPDGGIITAVTLDANGAVEADDAVSFRLVNWQLQLFISGYPYGADTTNPALATTIKVDGQDQITANTWTRVFATISPDPVAKTTQICVIFYQLGRTPDQTCLTTTIAFPTLSRSHLYIGDGTVLNVPNGNFRGLIEGLRIWRYAFSVSEITAMSSVPAADPRVVAGWNFDDCPIVGNPISTAVDTSGTTPAVMLACGNGDATKQPLCELTNSPVTQAGGFVTNPPNPANLGSGRTLPVTTPPPTTPPPTTGQPCPPPSDATFWGDPHYTIKDANGKTLDQKDFFGVGWFWIARTTDWDENEYGVQIQYVQCNGDKSCGEAVAWANKRERGWYTVGKNAPTIQEDGTTITWKGPTMTTPAGTVVTVKNGAITLDLPNFFHFTGDSDVSWSFSFDPSFSGLDANGNCADPVQGWGESPVAQSDMYYQGTLPPPCPVTQCVPPPALQPPVCPQSSAPNAACDGPTGVPCTWSDRCNCISQICWDTNFVSVTHRQSCLVDASGTGPFSPASVVPAMEATFAECVAALNVFLGTNPPANSPLFAQYPCASGKHCPSFCSGPCQGECDTTTYTCKCKTGWMGADCATPTTPGRKRDTRQVLAAAEVSGTYQSFFDVATFYSYDSSLKSATAKNPIQAPRSAAFFLHSQVVPPYLISPSLGATLPAGSSPVNSFGVTVNQLGDGVTSALSVGVKIVDATTGAAVSGASLLIQDDSDDSFSWSSQTGTGQFTWSVEATGTDGVVLTGLPATAFCVQVTLISASNIDKFVAVTSDEFDSAIPSLTNLTVSPGSSFQLCSQTPIDPCVAYTNCSTCNAAPACGWCESSSLCMSGTAAGPASGSSHCTTWRSETDPTTSRLVEHLVDSSLDVRTTTIKAYLAPDNAPVTVPVMIHLPATVGSYSFQVRGLFEFTDQTAPFAKFLGANGASIIAGINAVSPGSLFGVSSFRDKPHVQPHGRAGDWVYKEHVAFQPTNGATTSFTADFATWSASPQLIADWRYDLGLATLEALFQETNHGWPMHPATQTKNVVLVFTRSPVAVPGIPVEAADSASVELGQALPANNLDNVVDDYEDYTSPVQTAAALLERGIIPVFVVPDATGSEAVVASYRALVSSWGFGKVWPDAQGRNAISSSMSASAASAVISAILSDLMSTIQIVAADPLVSSTLATPALFSGSGFPLGTIVSVPITLERTTQANRKRDVATELFRRFYKDSQTVAVVGLGQFIVQSTITDAPSADDVDFPITTNEADPLRHIITLHSYSIYDQNMVGVIVSQPSAGTLYNILPGSNPETKGTAIDATGVIQDPLGRVYVDIPANALGDANNGYFYTSFTYKMLDSCGLESRVATVTVRVVPAGVYAPFRFEPPAAGFKATVSESTKWAPTSTLVCVGGADYDSQATITTKVLSLPLHGTLFHIVDSNGTPGAAVQVGDVVTDADGAMPEPAVACFNYAPPMRSLADPTPYGPAFDSFTWQLVSSTGLSSPIQTTSIDVTPVNYPPVTQDATVTGWQDTALPIVLSATDDPRPDGINNGAVSVKISAMPKHGTLKTKDGVVVTSSSPVIVAATTNGVPVSVNYVPDAGQASTQDASGALSVFDYFTFTATDTGGLSSTATIRVLVTPATAQPVIAFANRNWTFPLAAGNADEKIPVCLTVSNLKDASTTALYITVLPTQGWILINGQTVSAKPPVAVPATVSGTSGTWCFDYLNFPGANNIQDSASFKVCQGCGAPTDANFATMLAGAQQNTVSMQVGTPSHAASSGSGGLPTGAVVALAVVGSLVGLALVGLLIFLAVRARNNAAAQSNGNAGLKAPLL